MYHYEEKKNASCILNEDINSAHHWVKKKIHLAQQLEKLMHTAMQPINLVAAQRFSVCQSRQAPVNPIAAPLHMGMH